MNIQKIMLLSLSLITTKQTMCMGPRTPPDFTKQLFEAIFEGDVDLVKSLIKGINVNDEKIRYYGFTPLHYATNTKKNSRELIQMLLDAGANIEARDREYATPLHGAARSNNLEGVQTLLAAGADVNARSRIEFFGEVKRKELEWTPLFYAVESQNLPIVEALVAAGANVNAQSEDGITPLSLAEKRNNTAIINFLISKGAKKPVLLVDALQALEQALQGLATTL